MSSLKFVPMMTNIKTPMASNEDFLPLDRIKEYLRVSGSAEDRILEGLRDAGIEYLAKRVERTITDKTIFYRPALPLDTSKPICIRLTDIKSVVSLAGYCLLYTSPSPRDRQKSRMPSSA